jgi:D-arginine dehydrogenase
MPERIEADVVVIGAGIAGTGIAAELANDRRVVVLEREDRPGYHSTGRSAAIFVQNLGPRVIRTLSRASAPLFENADPAFFANPLLSPRGVLTIATEDGVSAFRDQLAMSEGMVEIGADEAVALVPILKRDRIVAASYEADARDMDVAALHQGWQTKLRRAGGHLFTSSPVRSGRRSDGRWEIEAADRVVAADVVVVACGAWSDVVASSLGARRVGLQPKRRSMAVLPAPAGHDIRRWPLVGDSLDTWYAKPDGGRLFVSPADQDPVDPHDAHPDDMVLAEGLHRFQEAVTHEVTRVERSWAGLRTFAPDGNPVVGYDPDVEGLFWLAGQGGYGIQTSPALSRLAAALVRREAAPLGLDSVVDDVAPARFRRGSAA